MFLCDEGLLFFKHQFVWYCTYSNSKSQFSVSNFNFLHYRELFYSTAEHQLFTTTASRQLFILDCWMWECRLTWPTTFFLKINQNTTVLKVIRYCHVFGTVIYFLCCKTLYFWNFKRLFFGTFGSLFEIYDVKFSFIILQPYVGYLRIQLLFVECARSCVCQISGVVK